MAVDKSYGSGYKNSGLSKATALKPGRLKKTAPTVAKARALKSRYAATAPSTARDKYSKKTVRSIQKGAANALEFATGVRVGSKGIKSVDPLALGMAFLPVGKVTRIATALKGAGKAKRAASLLARSASAERGRGIRDLISEARYIDDISRDALGPKDFGRASGQAGRYYEDALSNIRAAQKTRNNPSLVKTFPKINSQKKITQKNLRVGTKPTPSTRIIKVLKGER